jgi:hypothetical protein
MKHSQRVGERSARSSMTNHIYMAPMSVSDEVCLYDRDTTLGSAAVTRVKLPACLVRTYPRDL